MPLTDSPHNTPYASNMG